MMDKMLIYLRLFPCIGIIWYVEFLAHPTQEILYFLEQFKVLQKIGVQQCKLKICLRVMTLQSDKEGP